MKLWRKLFKPNEPEAEGGAVSGIPDGEAAGDNPGLPVAAEADPAERNLLPPTQPTSPGPEHSTLDLLIAKLAPVEPPLPEGDLESAMQGLAGLADALIPVAILEMLFHRGASYRSVRFWRSASRAFRGSRHLCTVAPLAEYLSEIPAHVPEWFLAELTAALGDVAGAESCPLLLALTHFSRGGGTNGGADVRRKAVEALTSVLERHAREISPADLRAIISLTPPSGTMRLDGPGGSELRTAPVDVAVLKSLSEAELQRR